MARRRPMAIPDQSLIFTTLRQVRSERRPRVSSISEVWDDRGLLRGEFHETDMEDKLMRRQEEAARAAVEYYAAEKNNGYNPPMGVKIVLSNDLVFNQIAHQYPFAVVWFGDDGKRKRKRFETVWGAVRFHHKAYSLGKQAFIVSLCRAYDMPTTLRNKIPKGWKWCPWCMTFRRYQRIPDQTFYTEVKLWNEEKQRFEWKDRKLQLMRCPVCNGNNRHPIFRRSNQPWHKTKIRRGRRRVRR